MSSPQQSSSIKDPSITITAPSMGWGEGGVKGGGGGVHQDTLRLDAWK